MKYTTLGTTEVKVSKICLGTMTWGRQNTLEEGHEQMNYALDQGVNFWDTAELYPVPAQAETYADTERIIGKWFAKNKKRDQVVLASKIAGPAEFTKHIRTTGFSPKSIEEAVDASLKRLQTDYIDLYQLHWPERSTNFFGKLGYEHDHNEQWECNFLQILESLNEQVKAGKIRHIGLSNETAWGAMKYLELYREYPELPRMQSVQNPYSLLNRSYEVGLAEVSIREQMGLLAYSPLGFGVLSGKYLGGHQPEKARVTLFPNFNRYSNEQAVLATQKYADLANAHGLTPTQLSLAFVNTRPFVTANIIGATTMDQLKENIESINVDITPELYEGIQAIHKQHPIPSP